LERKILCRSEQNFCWCDVVVVVVVTAVAFLVCPKSNINHSHEAVDNTQPNTL